VETSHPLRSVQEQALKPFVEKRGWKVQWHDNLDEIAPTDKHYTMVLAHEFFDALPFHLIEVSLLPNERRASPDGCTEIPKWMARSKNRRQSTKARSPNNPHIVRLDHRPSQANQKHYHYS